MEVDNPESKTAPEANPSNPPLAGSSAVASVTVSVHPLVLINISEHYTRVGATSGGKEDVQVAHGSTLAQCQTAQLIRKSAVIGALLGKQNGRHIELTNSFDLLYMKVENDTVVDRDFFKQREALHKEVFSDVDFFGWYAACASDAALPTAADTALHAQMCAIAECAILLKMDTSAVAHGEKLPVKIYESVIDIVKGRASTFFVPLDYSLATEQAERIGVDHVARAVASDVASAAGSKQLVAVQGAFKMLSRRLRLIVDYLRAVQSGELPRDESIIRSAAALCYRLKSPVTAPKPGTDSAESFEAQFQELYTDINLMTLLGFTTSTMGLLNEAVSMLNTVHDRQSGVGGHSAQMGMGFGPGVQGGGRKGRSGLAM